MTEDEAKTKWCPHVRLSGRDNRADGAQPQAVTCIGSACMAWRAIREEVSGTDADGFGYVRSPVTGGYCGLAGKP